MTSTHRTEISQLSEDESSKGLPHQSVCLQFLENYSIFFFYPRDLSCVVHGFLRNKLMYFLFLVTSSTDFIKSYLSCLSWVVLFFRLKVSCYYDINKTHAVAFHPRPRRSEPYAKNARGELQITMRLALGKKF